jgi:hypothetical protein
MTCCSTLLAKSTSFRRRLTRRRPR